MQFKTLVGLLGATSISKAVATPIAKNSGDVKGLEKRGSTINTVGVRWHACFPPTPTPDFPGFPSSMMEVVLENVNALYTATEMPFQFVLLGHDFHYDSWLCSGGEADQPRVKAWKQQAHQGGGRTLNIYSSNYVVDRSESVASISATTPSDKYTPGYEYLNGIMLGREAIGSEFAGVADGILIARAAAKWLGATTLTGGRSCTDHTPDQDKLLFRDCPAASHCAAGSYDSQNSILDSIDTKCMTRFRPSEILGAKLSWAALK